ncbi:MAG: hypothetical protein QXN01_01905, partial [Candidatus Anstonellales archaeon]
MKQKGQASLEYLIITALGISLIASLFYFGINYSTDNIRSTLAKTTVEKLSREVDYIHSLGPGSRESINIYIPEGTTKFSISGNTIHMQIALSSGISDVFSNTQAQLIGSL